MEPIQAIASLYAKSSLHALAFSALPDAPVQPYVEPRRRLRSLLASIHRPAGRPIAVRPVGYGAEC